MSYLATSHGERPFRAAFDKARLPAVLICLSLCIVSTGFGTATAQVGDENVEARSSVCRFCRSEQSSTAWVCTHCGRLFRIAGLDPANRFWGDAFYIFSLPTATSRPDLRAEVGADGLIREQAAFDLGDRYTYEGTGKGARITARVRAWNSKEVGFSATFEDVHDGSGRLTTRAVQGVMQSKPKRFLYRRIDFHYDDERIESAEVWSSVYSKASDWEKRPSQWLQHSVLEVHFEYVDDLLTSLHAARRIGTRDLRGNADYAEEEGFSEAVIVESGKVTGFGPPELRKEEQE